MLTESEPSNARHLVHVVSPQLVMGRRVAAAFTETVHTNAVDTVSMLVESRGTVSWITRLARKRAGRHQQKITAASINRFTHVDNAAKHKARTR